jgi:hypothetical protein
MPLRLTVSGRELSVRGLLAFSAGLRSSHADAHGLCVRLAVSGRELPVRDLLSALARLHRMCVRLTVSGR